MFSVLSVLIVSETISFSILFAPLVPSAIFLFWVKLWVKAAQRSLYRDLPVQTLLPVSLFGCFDGFKTDSSNPPI